MKELIGNAKRIAKLQKLCILAHIRKTSTGIIFHCVIVPNHKPMIVPGIYKYFMIYLIILLSWVLIALMIIDDNC